MEYIVTNAQPLAEIEAQIIEAPERQGLVVQRTFSLRSATAASANAEPGYSVLLTYGRGTRREPLGRVTLYQRGGRTVLRPELASLADSDLNARLVVDLLRGGFDHSCPGGLRLD